jgi:hypothetical protein
MSTWRALARPTRLAQDMDAAHRLGVGAASAGLQDAALGAARLTGDGVPLLADAAVSSATPFLRAPLISRISRALALHPAVGGPEETCPTCSVPVPCATALALT